MRPYVISILLAVAVLSPLGAPTMSAAEVDLLEYDIHLQTVLQHDDGEFLWFHPRVAAIPSPNHRQLPHVLMTLQKHLHVSDYYSGLHFLITPDLGQTWSDIELPSPLDWRTDANGIVTAVADVTPGWHSPTGQLLAIGAQVRYSPQGEQLEDQRRAHQTAYAVFDPASRAWSSWQVIDLPDESKFNFARSACAQWLVEPDGSLLLPFYFSADAKTDFAVTVVRCSFDGQHITYRNHGTEVRRDGGRGLYEPSLARFRDSYYLTLRSDDAAHVARGTDGLTYEPIRDWTFDDGQPLGSYNTQQHWLVHSDGLLLAYTRRGADNDHVFRHRAPLFIAQVEPHALRIIRRSERILIPERGATLGNFGAAPITQQESWVTVSEGVWNDDARRRGAAGATFVARIVWNKPNRLLSDSDSP